jgi:hypothetical protein
MAADDAAETGRGREIVAPLNYNRNCRKVREIMTDRT